MNTTKTKEKWGIVFRYVKMKEYFDSREEAKEAYFYYKRTHTMEPLFFYKVK